MMWSGSPFRDQLVADAAREWEIGDCFMHVSKLATPNPELDTAKPVLADRDAIPR
jgi:hypothetical protein